MTRDAEDSDEALMARLQDGSREAFALLVRRHSTRFYATAYRFCPDRDAAEDAVQEAFLKLWNNPGGWDAGKKVKFTTWFYRVVMNAAIDAVRKNRKYAGSDALEFAEDESPRQDRTLQQEEEEAMLERAIQTLPERQKAALNLCFYEELSNREAAEIMGIGIKALESLLMRAKQGVRDELLRQEMLRATGKEGRKSYG